MLVWIRSHWQNALRGFWLFPGLTALTLAVLAVVLIELDRSAGADGISYTFDGDASAARSILTTVGATVITVAGLAFSITVVTVQLVSSQFSPRTLRSFLADRPSQLIAGAFVGIFAYCLLVLRTVRDEGGGAAEFVPSLSVSVAIGLGLVGLVLLLVFIHRVTQVIKVESITGRVAAETFEAIESHYPEAFAEESGPGLAEVVAAWEATGPPRAVHPAQPGYVRAVESDLLSKLDLPGSSRIHLPARAGDQVTTSTAVVRVWCADPLDDSLLADLRRLVVVEREREVAADPAFGIRQLTDVALRALSPGVNDPTTAITCIGYLQEAFEQLAARRFPDPVRRLEPSGVLVAASTASFEELVREPFADLARFASGDARVASALLDALAGISAAAAAGAGSRVAAVLASAEDVAAPALEDARTASDRGLVAASLAGVRESAGYSTMQGPDGTRRSGPAAASSTRSTGTA